MISQLYKVHDIFISLTLPETIDIYKLKAQIPSIANISDITNIEHDKVQTIYVYFIESENVNVEKNGNSINIFATWNNTIKADLPHLIYGILRQHWIEQGNYPIHSICFENSLLIGHSGNGKTTLALSAMKKKIDIFSFDKTLVNFHDMQLLAKSGTDVISIRKELYEQECLINPELLNFDSLYNGDRVVLQVPISKSPQLINKVYLFYLNDIDLVKKSLTSLSSLHELYPFFLDCNKNDVIMNNGQYIFTGNVSVQSKQKLTESLKNWLCNIEVEILIGNKDDIIDYVKFNNRKFNSISCNNKFDI